MKAGLKNLVTMVVRASPEISINGEWLFSEFSKCISDLVKIDLNVRVIVTDNHSDNVSAFKILLNAHEGVKQHYFMFSGSSSKTYVFFDTVHLLKNIWNNLLREKRFVFPGFQFDVCGTKISSAPGYICWSDQQVYEMDLRLDENIRKAPKLTYSSLHPGDNKQNVEFAIEVFHETTIIAAQNYFPERLDIHNFLILMMGWWLIGNSTKRYTPNVLSNAVANEDGKMSFYLKFAD